MAAHGWLPVLWHRLNAVAIPWAGVALWAHCHGACGTLSHDTGLGGAWLCSSWLGTALFNQGQVYFAQGLTLESLGWGMSHPGACTLIPSCSWPPASP